MELPAGEARLSRADLPAAGIERQVPPGAKVGVPEKLRARVPPL